MGLYICKRFGNIPGNYKTDEMMKKFILALITVIAVGVTACAGNEDNNVDKLFKDFATEKSAEYVRVPRFLMWVGTAFASGDKPGRRIAKKIRGLRVLELSECDEAVKARFRDRVNELRNGGLEEIVRLNDSGEKVRIYGNVKGEDIKDLLVFCGDRNGECVLVEIKGKFEMGDLADIMDTEVKKYNGGK